MSSSTKFPSSVEIKRVINAAARAGIEVGSIEIHPRKIILHPMEKNASPLNAYDVWKMSQRADTERVKHKAGKTDAPVRKSRG